MSKRQYESQFNPGFFDTLDAASEHMTEDEFSMFYELFKHELSILEKNPYNNSRECEYGILQDQGFRTMTFHSKLPKIGTGDMRVIFKVDDDAKIVFYFAVGKRINKRPRPAADIYSKAESMLKDIQERNS
jgi:mRNA-degrading endonuclease RelE of RelBE toxin-antitoxin system